MQEVFMGIVIFITSVVLLISIFAIVYMVYVLMDRRQTQHSILRNYPFLGRARYIMEHLGPKMRQYITDSDLESTPFNRLQYTYIVRAGKYLSSLIGFGSKRDFDKPGFYLKNALFPKQSDEINVDNSRTVETQVYTSHEHLFYRTDKKRKERTKPWLLTDADAVVIGKDTCSEPFIAKGLIGMSGMSYGALGENAITALSEGIGIAGGSWMNTGEGGLSEYHLKGDADLIVQIGPAKYGVRDENGNISEKRLKELAANPKVRAFELKLGQGAKLRGGHLDSKKVTPSIAAVRGVEPWKTLNSPNRFNEFDSVETCIDFVERIRNATGKPVGIKLVVGGPDSIIPLAEFMFRTKRKPDFITVDGGEGGTGATYEEMADSVGLPINSALMILHETLKKYNVRDMVKIIASGKLFSSDRIATALCQGADLVCIARGFMISVGCIGTEQCHTGECPVGVATTDPKLQRALVIDEKKYRVANYILVLRKGLFDLAASVGLKSPTQFSERHLIYRYADGRTLPYDKLTRQQDIL